MKVKEIENRKKYNIECWFIEHDLSLILNFPRGAMIVR